jgi:uncharacterized protein YegL
MQRRLPIFLLVDISESMCGIAHEQLQIALKKIASDLRKDPQALETVFLSVVAFAGRAKTLVPLTDLPSFIPPELPLGGGTALGSALLHVFNDMDLYIKKPNPSQKGDWKPLIFLLTDGHPTDDISPALKAWGEKYNRMCRMVAVSIGGQADHALLKHFTEELVIFDPSAADAFSRFADWVSRSISVSSQAIERGLEVSICNKKTISASDPIHIISEEYNAISLVDRRFVFLIGRCSNSKQPYILKFGKDSARQKNFICEFSGALPENYFNFTEGDSAAVVNTQELGEAPCCPVCESKFSINLCRCGRMHCSDIANGHHTCPWCNVRDYYAPNHFDIRRGAG